MRFLNPDGCAAARACVSKKRRFGVHLERAAIIAAVIAVAALSGCSRTAVYVPEGPGPGVKVESELAPYATVRMNTVNILDKSLEDWQGGEKGKKGKIAVESTNARRTPSGTVEVWTVLRNRTDFPLQIEGRTQFFDRDQAPVEGPSAWKRVFLPPNSVATYKETSTKVMEIGYYYIEIREGR